jgi:hypothetical protein
MSRAQRLMLRVDRFWCWTGLWRVMTGQNISASELCGHQYFGSVLLGGPVVFAPDMR